MIDQALKDRGEKNIIEDINWKVDHLTIAGRIV